MDDVTQLSAYLRVLESVGQLSSDGERWRLAKAGRAVLDEAGLAPGEPQRIAPGGPLVAVVAEMTA